MIHDGETRKTREMFHMIHDGETSVGFQSLLEAKEVRGDSFIQGVILGLLIGEGHFGGDGKQPQVTLRMHVRHETMFKWLLEKVPGSKLYGPYQHGGRQYYQWMVRGEVLKKSLIPLLETLPLSVIDPYTYARYLQMKERYKLRS